MFLFIRSTVLNSMQLNKYYVLKKTKNNLEVMSTLKLFESKQIRSQWDAEAEKWYFSYIT